MRTHAYGRGSTKKQEASPEVQRQQLKDYCAAQGWGSLFGIWMSRPRLRSRCSNGLPASSYIALRPGDRVVITKLDRAFRNTREFLSTMEDWCRIGVSVHILNFMGGNAIDFSTSVGKLILTVLAAVAEFERDTISERTRETLRHLRAAGGVAGQPRLGFKYVKVRINGKLKNRAVPDKEERNKCATF